MYPDNNYTWLHYMYIFGAVYNPNRLNTPLKRRLCWVYSIFMICVCMLNFYPSQLSFLDHTFISLYKFLNSTGLFFSQTLAMAKWLTLMGCENKFDRIQRQLDSEDYHYEHYKDFKPGEIKFKCRKFCRILVVTLLFFGTFVPVTKDIDFFQNFLSKGDQIGLGNVTCLDMLPFYSYIPFNIETYWGCFWGLIYQTLPVFGIVGPLISFDLTFSTVSIYACGNLMNIQGAFRTMRERCLVRLGLPEDYMVLHDSENPKLEREIAAEVRKLSIALQVHIRLIEEMESACRYVMLGQAMTSLFVLVTCLYILSVEATFNTMLIAQIHYAVAIVVELANYCFVGDAVTQWTADVAIGIVSSDWLSCTKTTKMSLMINLMRLQKPIYFTIGKFSPLTLNTFLQIVKGSYSYFTFLQKT